MISHLCHHSVVLGPRGYSAQTNLESAVSSPPLTLAAPGGGMALSKASSPTAQNMQLVPVAPPPNPGVLRDIQCDDIRDIYEHVKDIGEKLLFGFLLRSHPT